MINFEKDIVCRGSKGGDLILVRGVPGSGKSTYAEEVTDAWSPLVHIEADMYFDRHGSYDFDIEYLLHAHRWCLNTARVMLRTRSNVLVANTFTKFSEAKNYIDHAKKFGHDIIVVTMNKEYGSIHNVPQEVMQNMRDRFESHQTFCEKINAYRPQ